MFGIGEFFDNVIFASISIEYPVSKRSIDAFVYAAVRPGDDSTLRCSSDASPTGTEQPAACDLSEDDVSPASTKTPVLGATDCRLCRYSCTDTASLQHHLVQVNHVT